MPHHITHIGDYALASKLQLSVSEEPENLMTNIIATYHEKEYIFPVPYTFGASSAAHGAQVDQIIKNLDLLFIKAFQEGELHILSTLAQSR